MKHKILKYEYQFILFTLSYYAMAAPPLCFAIEVNKIKINKINICFD